MVDVKIRKRYQDVSQLADEGATRGERRAAQQAMKRLEKRYGEEVKEAVSVNPPPPLGRSTVVVDFGDVGDIHIEFGDEEIVTVGFVATRFDVDDEDVWLRWMSMDVRGFTIRIQVVMHHGIIVGLHRVTW